MITIEIVIQGLDLTIIEMIIETIMIIETEVTIIDGMIMTPPETHPHTKETITINKRTHTLLLIPITPSRLLLRMLPYCHPVVLIANHHMLQILHLVPPLNLLNLHMQHLQLKIPFPFLNNLRMLLILTNNHQLPLQVHTAIIIDKAHTLNKTKITTIEMLILHINKVKEE